MSGPWDALITLDPRQAGRLLASQHATPHDVLGCHEASDGTDSGVLMRALHPDASGACVRIEDHVYALEPAGAPGLFGIFLPHFRAPLHPEVTFTFPDGAQWTQVDPYSFWPTLGDHDLHLFNEGKHFEVFRVMGARAREHEGYAGTAFSVWAPNADSVALVCDDNRWDGRVWPMRAMGSSGVFELFVPGIKPGTRYQFDVRTKAGHVLRKSDPYAEACDHPPGRASVVTAESQYQWGDGEHMRDRVGRDLARRAMNVYEVHPSSFRRHDDGRVLGYRELADALIPHMQHFGFTHLELMPICEHPFDGSWGYQVTGFYAPSARFGSPDDFRYLVDRCHQAGIDVIIDWVPAHFPKDDFALARFDGTALYEHDDPRQGEHPDWGTLIFNYGRPEVSNFLIGSALYFLQEMHVDGLRVDAVASMLYLDYSRSEGDWVPNVHGGRENIEALGFIKHLNSVIGHRVPGAYAIAEESTSWAGVTTPADWGGLGFAFKWNMGWMHDTLVYFAREAIHRQFHQDDLTFANVYEHSERFLMPLSHDEVAHGKGSLLGKMPGDRWQKFANLRTLLAYQYTRPGKKLVFMGTEFAQEHEWNYREPLPWPARDDEPRQAFMRFFAALGQLYLRCPALSQSDVDAEGFRFVDTTDHAQSVLSYLRTLGDQQLLVVLNLTPVPRGEYRIGVPRQGVFKTVFDSDAQAFGGSQYQATTEAITAPIAMHGFEHSVRLDLPPLGVLVLEYVEPETLKRARALGIAEGYYTIDGKRHVTSDETRQTLMAVLGEPPRTQDKTQERPPSDQVQPVYAAEAALDGEPATGMWIQLYALHSQHSWGIGDFGDLQRLLTWAGEHDLDFIGLNPLHAMRTTAQPAIPYHPTTRLFESPLYIDVSAVPEYRAASARGEAPADFEARLAGVRDGGNVDYPAVFELKRDALRMAYRELMALPAEHPRRRAFSDFAAAGGQLLRRFATYCSIEAELIAAGKPASGSHDFPEALRAVASPEVERYAEVHADEVGFQGYLQFLVDEQLAQAAASARAAGMRIGLYLDLAVGTAHGGFDAWCFPTTYVPDVSLGAPPDDLAPQGQDWGLVPLHPHRLLEVGCEPFRLLLRAAMRHAGAVRIDHAMALTRQFWIPRGDSLPGTYVAFPERAMLDVLSEESQRANCVVVAEDLGTVPEGFREALAARAILRYEVVHFERDEQGELHDVDAYGRHALLCLTTHDMPTFPEFWRGEDLLLRRDMGLFDEATTLARVQARVSEKAMLLRWLERNGAEVDSEANTEAVLAAAHSVLARAPSLLVCLAFDDLTHEPHGVNVPGTSPDQGFVSFARRMHKPLDEQLADPTLSRALRLVLEERKAQRDSNDAG